MNGKTLISAICLLLAFCLALYFYADWQQQRFDAALPVPPPAADEQPGGHGKPGDDAHDNDTGDLIPSDDWQQHIEPRELVRPENLGELDPDDPIAKAWAKLDEIAEKTDSHGEEPHTPKPTNSSRNSNGRHPGE